MKRRIFSGIIALLLCLSLSACSGEPAVTGTPAAVTERPDETGEPVRTPAPTEAPEETRAPAESPDISLLMTPLAEIRDDEGVMVFSGFYSEPVLSISGRDEAADLISKELAKRLASGGDEADELYDAACEHYESLDEASRPTWLSYSLSRSGEVKRGDGAIISVLGSGYRYGGGAHGSSSYFGMVFSAESGEKLSLGDIFSDTDALKLKVTDSALAQVEQMDYPGEFFMVREFVEDALEGEAWYLSNSGLELIASEGEVASSARGSITFVIPYSELEGLIHDRYLPVGTGGGAKDASAFSLSFEKPSEPLVSVKLDRDADTFYISANEDTAAFSFCNINYGGKLYVAVGEEPAEDGYVPGRGYLWMSGLKKGECIEVTGYFADVPNLGLEFEDGSMLVLAQSGKDGSLLIYEAE